MPNHNFRGLAIAFLIIAGLGFVDAAYLTIEHYANKVPPCVLVHGCDIVTTSKYAVIAGVPISLAGAAYYLVMIIGSLLVIDSGSAIWLKRMAMLSVAGFLFSLYLIYIQAFALHSYCIYCLGSAASSTLLFLLGLITWFKLKRPVPAAPTV